MRLVSYCILFLFLPTAIAAQKSPLTDLKELMQTSDSEREKELLQSFEKWGKKHPNDLEYWLFKELI